MTDSFESLERAETNAVAESSPGAWQGRQEHREHEQPAPPHQPVYGPRCPGVL